MTVSTFEVTTGSDTLCKEDEQLFFAYYISDDEHYNIKKLQGFLTLIEEAYVLVKSLFITLKTSIVPKIC